MLSKLNDTMSMARQVILGVLSAIVLHTQAIAAPGFEVEIEREDTLDYAALRLRSMQSVEDALLSVGGGLLVNSANAAVIRQQGSGNTATVFQQGTDNVSGIWQDGADNYGEQEQIGNNNIAVQTQQGSDNSVLQSQSGDDNFLLSEQIGNGHNVTQIQQGNRLNNVTTVTGTGVEISIIQSN